MGDHVADSYPILGCVVSYLKKFHPKHRSFSGRLCNRRSLGRHLASHQTQGRELDHPQPIQYRGYTIADLQRSRTNLLTYLYLCGGGYCRIHRMAKECLQANIQLNYLLFSSMTLSYF